MSEPKHQAFVDPALPWEGEFPYRVLRRFGITPDSPADAVQDASFDMSASDLADAAVNLAWEKLRVPRRRLVIDFFCYALPPEASPAPEAEKRADDYPLPWTFVRTLAQTPPPQGARPTVAPAPMPPALGGALPLWETTLPPHRQEGAKPDEP